MLTIAAYIKDNQSVLLFMSQDMSKGKGEGCSQWSGSTHGERAAEFEGMVAALGAEGVRKPWLYMRRHGRWAVRADARLPWPVPNSTPT